MATNIEINYYDGNNYEVLYPKIDLNNAVKPISNGSYIGNGNYWNFLITIPIDVGTSCFIIISNNQNMLSIGLSPGKLFTFVYNLTKGIATDGLDAVKQVLYDVGNSSFSVTGRAFAT